MRQRLVAHVHPPAASLPHAALWNPPAEASLQDPSGSPLGSPCYRARLMASTRVRWGRSSRMAYGTAPRYESAKLRCATSSSLYPSSCGEGWVGGHVGGYGEQESEGREDNRGQEGQQEPYAVGDMHHLRSKGHCHCRCAVLCCALPCHACCAVPCSALFSIPCPPPDLPQDLSTQAPSPPCQRCSASCTAGSHAAPPACAQQV